MSSILVRPARKEDHYQLDSLIHFEPFVHRHLDWKQPLAWIGCAPFLVAEQNGRIVAALACPPDPPGVAWIRIYACKSSAAPRGLWSILWNEAWKILDQRGKIHVATLALSNWYVDILKTSSFVNEQKVVALAWQGGVGQIKGAESLNIREMTEADLDDVHEIDHISFQSIWRISKTSLQLAFEQAAVATIYEIDQEIVGYQISTSAPLGGHLARLAVHPKTQGKGIGYSIVTDLIQRFMQLGALQITVNTQFNNHASLRLYHKTGFRLLGEEYPVYEYEG